MKISTELTSVFLRTIFDVHCDPEVHLRLSSSPCHNAILHFMVSFRTLEFQELRSDQR